MTENKQSIKLKPCPFCGGEAELKQTSKIGFTIKCKSCFIKRTQKTKRLSLEWLEEEMVKNWNTRQAQKGGSNER